MIQTRAGVPLCPRCGENDRCRHVEALRVEHEECFVEGAQVALYLPGTLSADIYRQIGKRVEATYCDRCKGFVEMLAPLPGRHVPDF